MPVLVSAATGLARNGIAARERSAIAIKSLLDCIIFASETKDQSHKCLSIGIVATIRVEYQELRIGDCEVRAVSSGFFFCLQSQFLAMFNLLLTPFLEQIAPVAAGDHELVGLKLRMNTLCSIKQIRVERIFRVEEDAGETVTVLPLYAFQPLL